MVFQDFELLDYLSVLDNIQLPYRLSPALQLDGAVTERAACLGRSHCDLEQICDLVVPVALDVVQHEDCAGALRQPGDRLLEVDPAGRGRPRDPVGHQRVDVVDRLFETPVA